MTTLQYNCSKSKIEIKNTNKYVFRERNIGKKREIE